MLQQALYGSKTAARAPGSDLLDGGEAPGGSPGGIARQHRCFHHICCTNPRLWRRAIIGCQQSGKQKCRAVALLMIFMILLLIYFLSEAPNSVRY